MGVIRLTLDLPEALGARIMAVSASEGRAPEEVALEALQWQLEEIPAFTDQALKDRIARSDADIAADRLIPHDKVMASLDAIIAEAGAKRVP